ncbi:MAG: hypothetical protein KGJ13_05350 [Patescibacteria group bacterium]|nr:hypothetical protein [Patescibacteria group bacterium]
MTAPLATDKDNMRLVLQELHRLQVEKNSPQVSPYIRRALERMKKAQGNGNS